MRRLLWPSAVLAAAAIAAGAAPAAAAGPLAPGDTRETVVALPSGWTAGADRLGVAVGRLDQQENGCLAPEVGAGDTTCAADGGELAQQLTATVAAGVLDGPDCVVTGSWTAFSLLDTAQTRLVVSAASCLALRLEFAQAGGAGDDDNLAQSDTLSFQLRVVAEGPGDLRGPGGTPAVVVADVDTAGPAAPDAPGTTRPAGTAAPAGRVVAAQAAAGQAVAGQAAAGQAAEQAAPVPVAGTPLGQVQSQVSLGEDTVAVETVAATTSFGELIMLWGSLLVGAALIGWLFFLLWRRRRQGRAA